MANVLDRLPQLIEQGDKFTYENFSDKGEEGYPSALSPQWLVWTHHATVVAKEITSPVIAKSIQAGLSRPLIDYGRDDFEKAKKTIMNGLRAALEVSQPAIPASDRIVTLGHNSNEQIEALSKIDALAEAVEKANDFPGSPEEQNETVVELSAARRLFEAARVRTEPIRALLMPKLTWLVDKAGGAMIGKIAGDLLEYLMRLKFF